MQALGLHHITINSASAVDGTKLDIFSAINLPVTYKGSTERVEFQVAKGRVSGNFILGTNALNILGFVLKDARNNLEFNFAIQAKQSDVPAVLVADIFADADFCVQPRTIRRVKGYLQSELSSGTLLVESHDKALPVEPCLTEVKDSRLEFWMPNHSLLPIYSAKDQLLGTAAIVDSVIDQDEFFLSTNLIGSISSQVQDCNADARLILLTEALDHACASLDSSKKSQLHKLLSQFADSFAVGDHELGQTSLVQHQIDVGDSRPIKQPLRPVPYAWREIITAKLGDLLDRGIIRKSCSPWASRLRLVKKKDGDYRICVDYRALNAVTKKDAYPLPNIDDLLLTLGKSTIFSTLDLLSGHWQIRMDPQSIEKTAFVTNGGLYEFTVMPFGLSNAVATFQRFVERVLGDSLNDFAFCYLDDIIICSTSWKDHVAHIAKILHKLRSAGLRLKLSKCKFGCEAVQFLGHLLTPNGVKMDPEKVMLINEYPVPQNSKELTRFHGLVGYYRKFIQNFAHIAAPFYPLMKKDYPFVWTSNCQLAFESLKQKVIDDVILRFPDFQAASSGTKPFIIFTDASKQGLGVVLSQADDQGKVRPIYFAGRKLNGAETRYHPTEIEALAIRYATKRFMPLLIGMKIIVVTDHRPLVTMLKKEFQNSRVDKWAIEIAANFNIEIIYREGKFNHVADAISRMFETEDATAVKVSAVHTAPLPPQLLAEADEKLWQIEVSCGEFARVYEFLRSRKLPDQEQECRKVMKQFASFSLLNNSLYFVDDKQDGLLRLVVPDGRRADLFKEHHGGVCAIHTCGRRVYNNLRKFYFWPNMRADCEKWALSCKVCALTRPARNNVPPLGSFISTAPFELVCIDLLKLGPTRSENLYVCVMVDHYTKWLEAVALPQKSAELAAKALVERIVLIHGAPKEIHSDQGTEFVNELWKELNLILGIKRSATLPYMPRSNGLAERTNRELINSLKRTTLTPQEWDERLPYVVFAHNISVQESTGETPFMLVYGRDPNFPSTVDPRFRPSIYAVEVDDFRTALLENIYDITQKVRCNLDLARKRQKLYYDKNNKVNSEKYRLGQRVMYLNPAQNLRSKYPKLDWPYLGPYRIIQLSTTSALIRPVDKPFADSEWVPLERLSPIPPSVPDIVLKKKLKRAEFITEPFGDALDCIFVIDHVPAVNLIADYCSMEQLNFLVSTPQGEYEAQAFTKVIRPGDDLYPTKQCTAGFGLHKECQEVVLGDLQHSLIGKPEGSVKIRSVEAGYYALSAQRKISAPDTREELFKLLGGVPDMQTASITLVDNAFDPKELAFNPQAVSSVQAMLVKRCRMQSTALEMIGDQPIRLLAPKFANNADFMGTSLDFDPIPLEFDRLGYTLEKVYANRHQMEIFSREVLAVGNRNAQRIAEKIKADFKPENSCLDKLVLLARKIKTTHLTQVVILGSDADLQHKISSDDYRNRLQAVVTAWEKKAPRLIILPPTPNLKAPELFLEYIQVHKELALQFSEVIFVVAPPVGKPNFIVNYLYGYKMDKFVVSETGELIPLMSRKLTQYVVEVLDLPKISKPQGSQKSAPVKKAYEPGHGRSSFSGQPAKRNCYGKGSHQSLPPRLGVCNRVQFPRGTRRERSRSPLVKSVVVKPSLASRCSRDGRDRDSRRSHHEGSKSSHNSRKD